ncbi:GDYXXLXY domain-containing protein [Oligoflexia bacterium]|nr:GDYXXLXY domain-containing protein [Oligoflexia bacterium]
MFLTKRTVAKLFIVAIGLQGAILSGQYLNSVYPLYLGKEVRLKIQPVDPRSKFRGQYVALNYDIGSIPNSKIEGKDQNWSRGDSVYVSLVERSDIWEIDRASAVKPSSGVFIRGKIVSHRSWSADSLMIAYGIEAYFASPAKALELEGRVRSRRAQYADVKVASNGKAALVDIVTDI